ncbi:MAG: hypothetical protein KAT56_10570, partial [Sedimentisphaerales bacterium]|nr:hypothetical protein [Sedimentisphaerales bacterium]
MPDVNIHLKTQGAEDTRRKLKLVAGSTREMETETKKASTGILSNLKSIGGALGFAGLAATAIAAIRKIILALDDMKKAVSETVQELASQQKAAADYFEAMSAYTPAARRKALGQARSFQGKTGLDFDSSKNLLEAYQRTFGQIDTEATEQLAGYQQLHGGTATPDLIRWMGASGVKGKKRQGQIMRMVSATAEQTGLRDDEVIRGVTQYSTEFREFGWTPEQAIENVGRVMSGLTRKEARRAMSGLVEGL